MTTFAGCSNNMRLVPLISGPPAMECGDAAGTETRRALLKLSHHSHLAAPYGFIPTTWLACGATTVPSGNLNAASEKFAVTVTPFAKTVCCTPRSGVRKR